MKDGERLVWSAAFAVEMSKIGDPSLRPLEEVQCMLTEAASRAYLAVEALRNMSRADVPGNHPALTMLRDMAGASN